MKEETEEMFIPLSDMKTEGNERKQKTYENGNKES